MSLIQDALKRKSEESAGVHLPLAVETTPEEPSPKRKNPQPLLILLIILLLTGLIAALIGLSLYLIKPKIAVQLIQKAVPAVPVVSTPPPASEPPAGQTVAPEVVRKPVEPVKKDEQAPEVKPSWPELMLAGIAQAENHSLAILNGKMISAGRSVSGVTVIEVHEKDIIVEYRGERRTLYINE
jgi:hypothetical protein